MSAPGGRSSLMRSSPGRRRPPRSRRSRPPRTPAATARWCDRARRRPAGRPGPRRAGPPRRRAGPPGPARNRSGPGRRWRCARRGHGAPHASARRAGRAPPGTPRRTRGRRRRGRRRRAARAASRAPGLRRRRRRRPGSPTVGRPAAAEVRAAGRRRARPGSPSGPTQRVGEIEVDRLRVERGEQLVHPVQPGHHVRLHREGVGAEPATGEAVAVGPRGREARQRRLQPLREHAEQVALVGPALGAEASDGGEGLVAQQVVRQPVVDELVVDHGQGRLLDAEPGADVAVSRGREVEALVVTEGGPLGQTVGAETHERVLLVALDPEPRRGVEVEHRDQDVIGVAGDPGRRGVRPVDDAAEHAAPEPRPRRHQTGEAAQRARAVGDLSDRDVEPGDLRPARLAGGVDGEPRRIAGDREARVRREGGVGVAAAQQPVDLDPAPQLDAHRLALGVGQLQAEGELEHHGDVAAVDGPHARGRRPRGPERAERFEEPVGDEPRDARPVEQVAGLPGVRGHQDPAVARAPGTGELGEQSRHVGPGVGGALGRDGGVGGEPVQGERPAHLRRPGRPLVRGDPPAALRRRVVEVAQQQRLLGVEEPVAVTVGRRLGPPVGDEGRDVADRLGGPLDEVRGLPRRDSSGPGADLGGEQAGAQHRVGVLGDHLAPARRRPLEADRAEPVPSRRRGVHDVGDQRQAGGPQLDAQRTRPDGHVVLGQPAAQQRLEVRVLGDPARIGVLERIDRRGAAGVRGLDRGHRDTPATGAA
ncbi:collagen alpha-1(I) chain-like, partial [Herrania umbratica]|uniref:Collagen alpha-1(I) chain-like n=1 Tax=Herrania umbratica TaxID=108875 RepID=A0A6J1BLV6_9ROSI